MDKKIEKKTWNGSRIGYLAGSVSIIILLFFAFNSFNKKVYNLNVDRVSFRKVVEGDFQNVILIDGDIEPINLVLVNTIDGGIVEEIFIEDGVMVEKGTPLMRLNNPSVTMGYMNQETAIVEQINNLRNLKLSLEKDLRNLDESLIDSENSLSITYRKYKVDSLLYVQDIIPKNDYVEILESYHYQQKKYAFLKKNAARSAKDNKIQIQQINASIVMMTRNLDMIHENIERMLVLAPVTGLLSSFDPKIGESFSRNQNVAKIDVLAGFKVKGWVDEYYLSSVKFNQLARFSLDGELIELKVQKVLPEVVNNRFEIELIFKDSIPKSIAIGQSLQVRLELSKSVKSLLIPRGDYFQSSGGQYVFVTDSTGYAHKKYIKLGSQNPTYYQVLGGLKIGDEIISSSYDDYKNYETIKLNN